MKPHENTLIDVLLTLIATLPAVIAAVSSLRNGKKIEHHREAMENGKGVGSSKAGKSKSSKSEKSDWYHPPNLN